MWNNLHPPKSINTDILVIGSGPGGAVTACLLAEAGRQVLRVEEGPNLPISSAKSYSVEEMKQKYRNSGITPAFGRTKVAYVEACCAGGGSEINAGLYHRLPTEIINHWREEYQIADFEETSLEPFFISNEEDLSISYLPYQAGLASMRLKQGADAMNWNVREVPKWSKYKKNSEGTWQSTRQSMTETFIPRALAVGCQLLAQTQIIQIKADKQRGK